LSNWRASGEGAGRVNDASLAVSADQFPLVVAAKEVLRSSGVDARFEWAIDAIIDGIISGRAPASPATTARGNPGRKRRPGSAPPRA
jgi:hypothetical protein